MDSKAVYKAQSRLRLSEKALKELSLCKSHQEFEDIWYNFLVASKNVYTVLEQGSKSSAQSRQWFGGKSDERRNDPLLAYLFHARDDDEHGLNAITEFKHGSLNIGVKRPGFSNSFYLEDVTIIDGKITIQKIESLDNKPVLIEQRAPHTVLATVTSRGNKYAPPTEHKGTLLETNLPIPVAALGFAYLKELVEEAKTLL